MLQLFLLTIETFKFTDNVGKLLETIVYWDLIRSGQKPYYYKTVNNYEVDFYLPDKRSFFQVSSNLDEPSTKQREYQAITQAKSELHHPTTFQIITLDNYIEWSQNPNLPTE